MSCHHRQSCHPPGVSVAQRGKRAVSVVQPGTLASAISSLYTSQDACAAPPGSETRNLTTDDLFDLSDLSDEYVPSPKKLLPDFTLRKSDDDSVASGDDSIAWEKEEDRVLHAFAIQVEAEDALEDALEDAPVKELEEWELIAEGMEGTADKIAAPPPVDFETRTFHLKTTNVKLLKAISLLLNLAVNGKKEVLFNRIRDFPHAIRVSDEEFQYRHPKVAGEKIPTWILITPKDVPTVDGIDMNTGTEKGFYGPPIRRMLSVLSEQISDDRKD